MARRKKSMTLEEEMANLNQDISQKEAELKEMKARMKELCKMKEEAEIGRASCRERV